MIHTQNEGIYRALIAQLDKLARHNRQESYKTRQRYYEAMQRFCRYLAEEYRLQKLANISGKHLVAYVRHLQENGKAASTIKTELAAIRFWHDQISNTKHKLPSNADLADQAPLERRKLQGIDRHWTPEQFTAFVAACREADRTDYADIATLTYYVGLRIHEVCRLDTAAVEAWERTGVLTVKGKGGRVRSVPVEAGAAKQALRDRRAAVQRGHKLFVPDDVATDAYIRAFQGFLREHRPDQGANPRPLTHHGLRHSYAIRQYQTAVDGGASEHRAKLDVSHLLGHGRADVTKIYLASAEEDEP
ncbi:tyrosine-type recombinase/integrase [uncultured Dysosmobacter sp.]|uniref:tyrosine-type recombinase/integrase n=1 Tax=uncultured Dysosmobacter sp. TaxID=2591384 RepID=UPI00267177BA|nr:tyrosine-type recombinase/integrase [uncultured Dysosmobacter sp.]